MRANTARNVHEMAMIAIVVSVTGIVVDDEVAVTTHS